MSWKLGYADDEWWAYDPDDGQLLEHDGEDDYDHVADVSAGLSSVKDAVAEYHFVPRYGYRYRFELPNGRRVYYDTKDGEYGTVKNGVDNHLERDKDLIGAHVPFAKVFIEEKSDATDSDGSGSDSDDSDSDSDDSDSDSNSDSDADSDSDDSDDSDTDFDDSDSDSDSDDEDSDMDDDDVPANGLRHRMSLACGTDVFFDSGDGEWGFVKEADAKKIIYDELDWGNSYVADGRARGSDEESDHEQDETQDGDRRLPYPFQYRLFPTVNRHRDKKGIC